MFKRIIAFRNRRNAKKNRKQLFNFEMSSLKKIEQILHPCPKVNSVEILHRHHRRKIIFSAWAGNVPFNKNRTVEVSREDVLNDKDFYRTYGSEFAWLSEGSSEASSQAS